MLTLPLPNHILRWLSSTLISTCFDTTSREKIRDELTAHFPELLYIFGLLYLLGGNASVCTAPRWHYGTNSARKKANPRAVRFRIFLVPFTSPLLASDYTKLTERTRRRNIADNPLPPWLS